MEFLEKLFKKSGWISILESIIFAIIGMVLIKNPTGVVKVISYILGGLFIIAGLYKIIRYGISKGKYDFYNNDFIYGVLAIVIGIVTMVYSSTIGAFFRIMIGVWIIYSALMRFGLAIKLKRMNLKIWIWSLGLALIMFILGLFITLNSGAVVVTIGVMMIISAVIDIVEDIIFIKNVNQIL